MIFRTALCAALLLLAAACGTARTPSLTEAAAPYRPISIATGVPTRPGAMAWSPDSSRLAFISDSVTVVDVRGEALRTRRIDIKAPRFLAWADDGTLSVLTRENDRDILVRVDAAGSGITRMTLDRRADAVYPLDDRRLLLLSLNVSQLKFGTEFGSTLSRFDLASGTTSTLHASSRVLQAGDRDVRLLTAWAHAGPNPLDGSFLLVEHFKPPVAAPYSRVLALDLASGELREISRQDQRTIYLSAGWSPDGRTIALTGPGGHIEFRGLQGDRIREIPAQGLYPAWHPAGELLAVGGALVSAAAGTSAPLLTNGVGSLARWSPDGTRLALAAGGELLLFRDIAAPVTRSSPLDRVLKEKLHILQELLLDDLITREEYRERRSRLLSEKEGGLP
ncbi:MAG: hypothetical protein ACYC7L_10455 [Nitrospirota bacterium]